MKGWSLWRRKKKPLLKKSGVLFEYRSDYHVPIVAATKTKSLRGSGRRQPLARMVTNHFSGGLIEPLQAHEPAGNTSSSLEENSDNVPRPQKRNAVLRFKRCVGHACVEVDFISFGPCSRRWTKVVVPGLRGPKPYFHVGE